MGRARERQLTLLRALGLPTEMPYGLADLLPLMRRDKKSDNGSIRLVLPTGIGFEPIARA